MADGTFYRGLHPLFVTSAAVTDKVIDDFLQSSNDGLDKNAGDFVNNFSWTLQRSKKDAALELERVKNGGSPMCGTRPPVDPNGNLDFENWSIDELAAWVLEEVGRDEIKREGEEYVEKLDPKEHTNWWMNEPHLDTEFFGVLDDRSVDSRSVLLVQIPKQTHYSPGSKMVKRKTRNWIKRDRYDNDDLWEDEEGYKNELKAVRITFSAGWIPDDMNWNSKGMIDYADEADEKGVWSKESASRMWKAHLAKLHEGSPETEAQDATSS